MPDDDQRGLKPAILFAAMFLGAWTAQALHPGLALHLPGAPWNWLLAAGPTLCAASLGLVAPATAAAKSLGSGQVAIASLVALAMSCWPIAMYPVGSGAPDWLHRIGLGDPLSSLPFAVAILAVTVNLAVSLGRRLRSGEDRVRFVLLHGGLLIAVVGGTAGQGGLVRSRFILEEGARPGDAAQAEDGTRIHLPVALALDAFVLDRFPPMLLLEEGGRLTRGEALLGAGVSDQVGGLAVSVQAFLPQAAVVSGKAMAFRDPAANPAAEVLVHGNDGQVLASGWLHPGGPLGPPLSLALPDGRVLHLEAPRARRFLARVQADGKPVEITVNHPLRVDGWAIYLLSYDESLGPASRSAVFEAVEDRALPAVYVGLAMLVIGVLGHLWSPVRVGGRR